MLQRGRFVRSLFAGAGYITDLIFTISIEERAVRRIIPSDGKLPDSFIKNTFEAPLC